MQEAKANVRQLNLIVLSVYGAVALILVYWSVVQADWLALREDNPRLVEVELRTQRGTIYDTNNRRLAWTAEADNGVVDRRYAEASGAAVGYYSFRFGAAGIERSYDAHLRGTDGPFWQQFIRDTRHEPRIGHDVRLTIDSRWQALADAAMRDQSGAAVLISLPDHALRVMASYPSFDPNLLDEQFAVLSDTVGAPLLNRATQGVYQPGGVLQPFVYASALDRDWLRLDELLEDGGAAVEIGDLSVGCVDSAENPPFYAAALRAVCPAPIANLTTQTTHSELDSLFARYGFAEDPTLPFNIQLERDRATVNVRSALLGQDATTVTPLQVAIAWAGLASGGERQTPQVVSALENAAGAWQTQFPAADAVRMVSAESASTIIANLSRSESLIEHTAFAIADTDGSQTVWYLALGPVPTPRYALVLVVEDGEIENARNIGRNLMRGVIGAQ